MSVASRAPEKAWVRVVARRSMTAEVVGAGGISFSVVLGGLDSAEGAGSATEVDIVNWVVCCVCDWLEMD